MPMIHTLTAASTTLNLATTTACQLLDLTPGSDGPTGDTRTGHQVATFHVTSDHASEAGVIYLVLYDPNNTTKVAAVKGQLTVTAFRTNAAGSAANEYICDIAFPDLTNKIDLNGLAGKARSVSAAGVPDGPKPLDMQWYICCSAITGTSLKVYVTPTRTV